MAPPFALLSAEESDENLLITVGEQQEQTGVELRRKDVDLAALGRIGTRSSMPVTGWDERFASVSTTLNLPPGNKLLAAPGADRAPGSWVSQWQLLDFFLVLIITIAAWRLFGRKAGIIALLALVLSFHELNAPAWVWLNLLIAVALMRVAPPGKLRQSVQMYQAVSAVLLVFALVPFLASQLRIAIYPQLEPQYAVSQFGEFGFASPAAVMAPGRADFEAMAPRAKSELRRVAPATGEALEEIMVTAQKAPVSYARYAPNAIVQAGPGIPSWSWNSYQLKWSGPVDDDQTMRLVILPRWAVTLLRFVEVLALLLFTAVFAAEILKRRIALRKSPDRASRVCAAVCRAGCGGCRRQRRQRQYASDNACPGRRCGPAARFRSGLAAQCRAAGRLGRRPCNARSRRGLVAAAAGGPAFDHPERRAAGCGQPRDSLPGTASGH
jgi:hypothetical protein